MLYICNLIKLSMRLNKETKDYVFDLIKERYASKNMAKEGSSEVWNLSDPPQPMYNSYEKLDSIEITETKILYATTTTVHPYDLLESVLVTFMNQHIVGISNAYGTYGYFSGITPESFLNSLLYTFNVENKGDLVGLPCCVFRVDSVWDILNPINNKLVINA